MNAVIYFSCTGRSKAVAIKLAEKLSFAIYELTHDTQDEILNRVYDNAVIVFPVHCQSYPKPMKAFFKYLQAENIVLVATYGSANAGNALYEAAELLKKNPIAAAYLPCNHSYLHADIAVGELPQEFIDKILNPCEIKLPKRKKTPFAGFLPDLRSRAIIKIKRNSKCTACGECNAVCPTSSMNNGVPNGKCIRCLKCVANCPHGALEIKKSRVLERYLTSTHCDDLIIYI